MLTLQIFVEETQESAQFERKYVGGPVISQVSEKDEPQRSHKKVIDTVFQEDLGEAMIDPNTTTTIVETANASSTQSSSYGTPLDEEDISDDDDEIVGLDGGFRNLTRRDSIFEKTKNCICMGSHSAKDSSTSFSRAHGRWYFFILAFPRHHRGSFS